MKSILLSIFLCLPFLSPCQIIFEHVSSPNDFSIGVVRKSPIGEYFVQASNDDNSIYTSLDGIDWNKVSLPVDHQLDEIQFFSDGTPVLKSEESEHLIRRNGYYHTMDAGGGGHIEISFVKDDTLFMYHNRRFAFSLDKGQTFTTAFVFDTIISGESHLWKFDNYFVLHHTAGASDRVSIFNESGIRVLLKSMALGTPTITYNTCGQVLFNDRDNFYLVQNEGPLYQSGPATDIIPQFDYGSTLLSQGGNYYLRNEDTVYKTEGCNFAWQFYAANDLIGSKFQIWFSHDGEIMLYNIGEDFFTVETNGAPEEYFLDFPSAHVRDIDEYIGGDQYSLTLNNMFSKKEADAEWIESDSIGGLYYQVQYSPGGEVYIKRTADIIYSADNGESYMTIPLHQNLQLYGVLLMEVLDDGVLFVFDVLEEGYYTLNYGHDWFSTNVSLEYGDPHIKLLDDYILVATFGSNYKFSRITISTNEITTQYLGSFQSILGNGSSMLEDGTVYFRHGEYPHSMPIGLFRTRFGEATEFLGRFSSLDHYILESLGNKLFALGENDYYVFDGNSFSERKLMIGLTEDGRRKFIMAQNEHLYVIVDNQHIFRSTEPLSMTIATNDVSDFIDFTVYPNPTKDKLTVTVSGSNLHRIDSYEIVDQLGRRINHSSFSSHYNINVAGLSPGLYNLLLRENGVVIGMKKFVKL